MKIEAGLVDPGALSELQDLFYDTSETMGSEAFDRAVGELRSGTTQVQRVQYNRVRAGLDLLEQTIQTAQQLISGGSFPEVAETEEASTLSEEASNSPEPARARDEQRR